MVESSEDSDDDTEATVEKCRFVGDCEGEDAEVYGDKQDTMVQSNHDEDLIRGGDDKNVKNHSDAPKQVL